MNKTAKEWLIGISFMIFLSIISWSECQKKYDPIIERLEQENKQLRKADKLNKKTIQMLYDANDSISKKTYFRVTATVYYPTGQEMASGVVIPSNYSRKTASVKFIAVSHDLLKKNGGFLSFGDRIKVFGDKYISGIYTVYDTTNKRFKNRVDVLVYAGAYSDLWKDVVICKI